MALGESCKARKQSGDRNTVVYWKDRKGAISIDSPLQLSSEVSKKNRSQAWSGTTFAVSWEHPPLIVGLHKSLSQHFWGDWGIRFSASYGVRIWRYTQPPHWQTFLINVYISRIVLLVSRGSYHCLSLKGELKKGHGHNLRTRKQVVKGKLLWAYRGQARSKWGLSRWIANIGAYKVNCRVRALGFFL